MDLSASAYSSCTLCPRRCGQDRRVQAGICGVSATPRIARAALHFWEEPPISGTGGSGTIFFSGCPLRCVYCQNREISHERFGREVGVRRLAAIMCELQEQGAHNINLVTALHFAPSIIEALTLAREAGMTLPIVCNSSGYEQAELVEALSPYVDIWLTDMKYASSELAGQLSGAPDYPEAAIGALKAMLTTLREKGGRRVDEDGIMQQGILVRHLVLPGHANDSCAVLDSIWECCGNEVDLSVMNQYTPNEHCRARKDELSHTVSEKDYERVLSHAYELGFEQLWWQEGGTQDESFIPPFDTTGIHGPEL